MRRQVLCPFEMMFGWVGQRTSNGHGEDEIQGSLRCGGKSAAFGRDDVCCGLGQRTSNGHGEDEIQGSLRCGGKSAAFGRDDVCYGLGQRTSNGHGNSNGNGNGQRRISWRGTIW